jgi:hypothetical protein
MSYTVTYRELHTTTAAAHDALQHLATEEVELAEITNNCLDYQVTAELYDAAGFRKGWVHTDGTYQLT